LDGSRLGCKEDDRDPIAGTSRNVALRVNKSNLHVRTRGPPETSLNSYQDKLRNDPEERISQQMDFKVLAGDIIWV